MNMAIMILPVMHIVKSCNEWKAWRRNFLGLHDESWASSAAHRCRAWFCGGPMSPSRRGILSFRQRQRLAQRNAILLLRFSSKQTFCGTWTLETTSVSSLAGFYARMTRWVLFLRCSRVTLWCYSWYFMPRHLTSPWDAWVCGVCTLKRESWDLQQTGL